MKLLVITYLNNQINLKSRSNQYSIFNEVLHRVIIFLKIKQYLIRSNSSLIIVRS